MTSSTQSLLQIANEYSDTKELADALRELSEDEAISPSSNYFLKESALHMEALYSSYLETVRALKSSSTTNRATTYSINPSTKFRNIEAWRFEDYLYLNHLLRNIYRGVSVGDMGRILAKDFQVPKSGSIRLALDLEEKFKTQIQDFMDGTLAARFGAAA